MKLKIFLRYQDVDFFKSTFLSANWIWTVSITVFFIPTVIIVVSYSLIIKKLYKDSIEASEAYQVTFVMTFLTMPYHAMPYHARSPSS